MQGLVLHGHVGCWQVEPELSSRALQFNFLPFVSGSDSFSFCELCIMSVEYDFLNCIISLDLRFASSRIMILAFWCIQSFSAFFVISSIVVVIMAINMFRRRIGVRIINSMKTIFVSHGALVRLNSSNWNKNLIYWIKFVDRKIKSFYITTSDMMMRSPLSH